MKKLLLILGITSIILTGCAPEQYEGKTAKEWRNMYYAENSDRINFENKYNDLQSEYNDLENEKSNLQDDYDELEGCVEDYPNNAGYECL